MPRRSDACPAQAAWFWWALSNAPRDRFKRRKGGADDRATLLLRPWLGAAIDHHHFSREIEAVSSPDRPGMNGTKTYLSSEEISAVLGALTQAGLVNPGVRSVLMQNIDPRFTGLLNNISMPAAQFLSDLHRMNQTMRISDGTIPMERYLAAALELTAALPNEAKVLREALDKVSRRSLAGPDPPPRDQLPEVKEKIVHHDDMLPIGFLIAAQTCGPAVAKIDVPGLQEDGTPIILATGVPLQVYGTSWLVTPDLLVTNHHVVNAREDGGPIVSESILKRQAAGAVVRFDYNSPTSVIASVTVKALLAWNIDLDYAVLALSESLPRLPLRLNATKPIQKKANDYIPVNIIQHPLGAAKKIAIRNNLVTATSATELRYFTDTQVGSSGSPVFDDSWRVVALHRGSRAVSGVSFQGRDVAWVNIGTQITAICAHLKQHFPSAWEEVARAQQIQ
jgi:hypothetical protein